MIEALDVADKLAQTLKTLSIERAALVAADASSEEIAEQDELAKDVKAALDLIASRASQRREEKEKRAKWEALLPECSTAKEEYEAAALAAKKFNEDLFVLEDALARAQKRLSQHLNEEPEPTDYAPAKTIRRWNMEKHRLEEEVEQRRKSVLELRQKQSEIGSKFQAAKQKFEQLVWRERQLRPTGQQPKVVALLEGVRLGPELSGVKLEPGLSFVR